jgi:hypothetical protein
MPYLDPVIDPKTWGQRGCQEEATIGGPLAVGGVGAVDGGDLGEDAAVVDLGLTRQIAEAGKEDESALRVEEDGVDEVRPEVVENAGPLIEQDLPGRHN